MADQALGGYDPNAGLSAHDGRTAAADPGAVAAARPAFRASGSRLCGRGRQRDRSGEPPTGRARAMSWVWQALAALLVASVFAAAVAQARLVAPGVSAAQRVLAAGVRSEEATTGAAHQAAQYACRAT